MTVRRRIHAVMSYKQGDAWTLVFSWTLTVMVLANVAAVILESIPELHSAYAREFHLFEVFSVGFFSIEYLLRLWTAPENHNNPRHKTAAGRRMGYVLSFHGIIDLLAILPFFLHSLLPGVDLRFLRIVRILRILKLSHYNTALEDLISAIYAERHSFISSLYLLAIALLVTSCLMYYAEHNLQPDKFGSIPESLWWSIVTLTTLGYGDAVPISGIGKLIGGFAALSGVLTVALLTGIVASAFTTRMRRQEIVFEAEVETALAEDQRISEKERRAIERLREEFGLTEEHAQAVIQRLRATRAQTPHFSCGAHRLTTRCCSGWTCPFSPSARLCWQANTCSRAKAISITCLPASHGRSRALSSPNTESDMKRFFLST
jgi:voltage-gated potassium channel